MPEPRLPSLAGTLGSTWDCSVKAAPGRRRLPAPILQWCPLFATQARNSVRCGIYDQRTVLVLERPKSMIVFVPQPWVVSPTQPPRLPSTRRVG